MITLRHIVPALCLATSVSGIVVYAATAAPATTTAPTADSNGGHQWRHGHHGGMGGMGFVLHKLNLTADQHAQIKSLMAGDKSEFEALHASVKSNRQALATTAPTDPSYAQLIETAQTNAATRIKLESQAWRQIYENVLTKQQRDEIPAIVAASQAARESKMADWKAQHPQS
jgi:Spy/CpxP family protein refolding chaperone